MLQAKIVVIGSINMDLVTRASKFPRAGETLLGNSFHRFMGGKGANQAIAAARLGADVCIVGAVGDDDFGYEMTTNLCREGIFTEHIQTLTGLPSGMANITVADDENAEQQIASADVVLSQLEIPMDCVITAAKLAKKYGKPFILNPAPAQFLPSELWELVTLLTPNRYELADCLGLSQDLNPEELILKAPCPVLMTMGDKGAVYKDGKDSLRYVSSFKVDTADTTGASDAFNGALSVFWNQGIETAVRKACAAAALSITQDGAQNGMPFKEELEQFLAAHQ